uniref:MHC class I-like antigen recognition-like domain-containing protein n=1 Tax=Laticauda laticaudata TaxID=8630 RepID=A0A8C5S4Y5_LATLA
RSPLLTSFFLLPPWNLRWEPPWDQGTFSHSMKYFYTSISDPSQGLPQFVTVGYVDGQPRVSWIEKVGKEDPQYWERETQISHGYEEAFRRNLGTLRIHYNQSEGLHIIEVMCVCEFRRDRSKGGVWQCGYEGMTFITFNKETFTWVAPDPQVSIWIQAGLSSFMPLWQDTGNPVWFPLPGSHSMDQEMQLLPGRSLGGSGRKSPSECPVHCPQ